MNRNNLNLFVLAAGLTLAMVAPAASAQGMPMPGKPTAMTSTFKGVEVNKGSVSLYKMGNQFHLRLSDDFTIPKTPAPHWQVVDGKGNAYLLNQLRIAGDRMNRDIALPTYLKDIKSVRIWCSFAEVNLGEANFARTMELR